MVDIPRAGDPRGTSLDIKEMDPTHTEKFTTTEKECSGPKTQQAHHTIMFYQNLVKAYSADLFLRYVCH